ncbi:MAG: hypothetical protein QF805_01525 [Pirellulaceae bacterium]|nr:hypothetical protein [Pirellulaceae bacterium]
MSDSKSHRGGVIHTYQAFDPKSFPSPTQPPPDLVSPALEHMLMFGGRRELTEEELARAVRIDPSQISGFGPSIDALIALLEERKRKILARYETDRVLRIAGDAYHQMGSAIEPPPDLRRRFEQAFEDEQIYDFERLWYEVDDDRSKFARQLVQLTDRLGDKYQIEELAAKYYFTGRQPLTVNQALQVKEELEKIDELLEQLLPNPTRDPPVSDQTDQHPERLGFEGGVSDRSPAEGSWQRVCEPLAQLFHSDTGL